MGKYYGLIIPRSYNDYINRSDTRGMLQAMINTGIIPATASEENKLADKDFVNSTVGTNTAIFRGTYNSIAELEQYSGEKTNNDYAFVIGTDTAGNTLYKRYKYNGTAWVYEYTLNNSSFTSEQWASIQSGITAAKVNEIGTVTPLYITNCNNANTTVCNTDGSTLNTPYKAGLTNYTKGILITTPTATDYMTQLYIVTGLNDMYTRRKQAGTWKDWQKVIQEEDLYYKKDETVQIKGTAIGFITSGTTSIYVSIKLPKRIPINARFTVVAVKGNARASSGGVGGYVDPDGSNYSVSGGRDFLAAANNATIVREEEDTIRLLLERTAKWYICGKNTDNNTPIVFSIDDIRFTIS